MERRFSPGVNCINICHHSGISAYNDEKYVQRMRGALSITSLPPHKAKLEAAAPAPVLFVAMQHSVWKLYYLGGGMGRREHHSLSIFNLCRGAAGKVTLLFVSRPTDTGPTQGMKANPHRGGERRDPIAVCTPAARATSRRARCSPPLLPATASQTCQHRHAVLNWSELSSLRAAFMSL